LRPALNSAIACVAGSIIPIADVAPASVNQRFPSGPTARENGWLPAFSPVLYSVIAPLVVIWPILPARSVNQRFPSGPARTCAMFEPTAVNSVIVPSGAAPLIAAPASTQAHTASTQTACR
jgi:hypothetical protein